MKSDFEEDELNLGIHQKSFDQQPPKTKELELLNEKVEKATGQEINLLQEMIVVKSDEVISLDPELDPIALLKLKNTSA